jgi:hypothetical protein
MNRNILQGKVINIGELNSVNPKVIRYQDVRNHKHQKAQCSVQYTLLLVHLVLVMSYYSRLVCGRAGLARKHSGLIHAH